MADQFLQELFKSPKEAPSFPAFNSHFFALELNTYTSIALYISLWTLILTTLVYTLYGVYLYYLYKKYHLSLFAFIALVLSGVTMGLCLGVPFAFLLGAWYDTGGYTMSPMNALLWALCITSLSFLRAISSHSEIL